MGEIIDDLINETEALLADKKVKLSLIALIRDTAENFLSNEDVILRFSQFTVKLILYPADHSLHELFPGWDKDFILNLGAYILEFIRNRRTEKGGERAGPFNDGTGNGDLSGTLPVPVQKPKKSFFSVFIDSFLSHYGDKTIAQLLAVDGRKKDRLDSFLCTKLLDTANEQIEGVLKTINVKTLVSDRIDSLDMIRVERIVLDVMANQLKWINLFGAILGALIGLVQVLFNWFL
jgi:hypothetical protein